VTKKQQQAQAKKTNTAKTGIMQELSVLKSENVGLGLGGQVNQGNLIAALGYIQDATKAASIHTAGEQLASGMIKPSGDNEGLAILIAEKQQYDSLFQEYLAGIPAAVEAKRYLTIMVNSVQAKN